MASREALQLLREARSGNIESQFSLGKLYLFGSKSLPQSLTTACHWLSRAAKSGNADARLLIGNHIPYETAKMYAGQPILKEWYKEAFEKGSHQAGFALAKLTLSLEGIPEEKKRSEAIKILEQIATQDNPEAQWLLAELVKASPKHASLEDRALKWTARAADAGILDAQVALIEHAWKKADYSTFLQHALPIVRSLVNAERQQETAEMDESSTRLLLRCGQLLAGEKNDNSEEVQTLWELAARNKNAEAAFLLGLRYARMDEKGQRTETGGGSTSFKKAIRWLTQAGELGLAKAWYALSLIYQKAEFSQRNIHISHHYLEKAANLGHACAQYERGMQAWRSRRENEANDIQAVYWFQKATGNGKAEAALMLHKIARSARPATWAVNARQYLSRDVISSHPFLVARIELAAVFGLSRPEALLLDIHSADKGHCLLVDIREFYRRSKRKMILIQTGKERQTLSRITRLFEKVDCGLNGPEGNYRQRQYRLKTLIPTVLEDVHEEETHA